MKQFLLLFSFLCLFFLPVKANDGVYYTSGNQLVPMQETDVSVRKEVLTITLLDSSVALVDVYYEFFNPNATSKTVLMALRPTHRRAITHNSAGVGDTRSSAVSLSR